MFNTLQRQNEALELQFSKLHTFSESVERLSQIHDPSMIQNEHVHAICCRRKVSGDVISGEILNLLVLVFSEILKQDAH